MAIGESATTVTVGDVAVEEGGAFLRPVEEVVVDAFSPGCWFHGAHRSPLKQ